MAWWNDKIAALRYRKEKRKKLHWTRKNVVRLYSRYPLSYQLSSSPKKKLMTFLLNIFSSAIMNVITGTWDILVSLFLVRNEMFSWCIEIFSLFFYACFLFLSFNLAALLFPNHRMIFKHPSFFLDQHMHWHWQFADFPFKLHKPAKPLSMAIWIPSMKVWELLCWTEFRSQEKKPFWIQANIIMKKQGWG